MIVIRDPVLEGMAEYGPATSLGRDGSIARTTLKNHIATGKIFSLSPVRRGTGTGTMPGPSVTEGEGGPFRSNRSRNSWILYRMVCRSWMHQTARCLEVEGSVGVVGVIDSEDLRREVEKY